MATELFDLDVAYVTSRLPQLRTGSGTASPDASITDHLEDAAARVNCLLIDAFSAAAPAEIAAATTSPTYTIVRNLVWVLAKPEILGALLLESGAEVETLRREAEERFERYVARPTLLGWTTDPGDVGTSTEYLDLDTSVAASDVRRKYDSRTGRLSTADNKPLW